MLALASKRICANAPITLFTTPTPISASSATTSSAGAASLERPLSPNKPSKRSPVPSKSKFECNFRSCYFLNGSHLLSTAAFKIHTCIQGSVFDCSALADGFYVNPAAQCLATYFRCSGDQAEQLHCPGGLSFEPETLSCEPVEEAVVYTGVPKQPAPATAAPTPECSWHFCNLTTITVPTLQPGPSTARAKTTDTRRTAASRAATRSLSARTA